MNDFQYYTPTKVVFGRGTAEQAGQLVKEQGGTRALVHFGGRSARESGLLDRVMQDGWKSLTSKETGRIGGLITKKKRENEKNDKSITNVN